MTDWEARYRAGDTPWDRGAPSPGLIDFLKAYPISGEVLVPGCGLGYDVRALAATADRVVGLDVARAAVGKARQFEGVGGEEYVLGDFFKLPEKLRGGFDWVFEHTCFCAFEPERRGDYVEAVAAALRPGGYLLAVFYLETGREEGPPHGTSAEELDQLFEDRLPLVRSWEPARTYEGREGCELMQLRSAV